MTSQRRHEGYAIEKEPKVRVYGHYPLLVMGLVLLGWFALLWCAFKTGPLPLNTS